MPKNIETTTKFKVDISELKKGIQDAQRQIRLANAEFKAASSGMDDWSKSADGVSAKLKQLNTTVDAQKKVLGSLEQQYAEVVKEQGETSKGAEELKIKIANQQAAINKTEKEIKKYESALVEVSDESDDVSKKSDKAADGIKDVANEAKNGEKEVGGLKDKLADLAKNGFAAIATAATGAVTAFFVSAEASREFREAMGKVDTAFTTAGFSAEQGKQTFDDFVAVLGDTDQATEAVGNLAKLADTQEDLSKWTEIATGVYGTFGDGLPIEGLTEAANETAKVGKVTGPLADALNWAGESEDEFNEKLAACNNEQERAQLITDTLTELYGDAADAYKETNGAIMDANRAQNELNEAMAGVGAAAEPVMTTFKLFGASLLTEILPGVEGLSAALTDMMTGVEGSGESVGNALSELLTGALNKIVELLPNVAEIGLSLVTNLISGILTAIPQLITTAAEIIIQLANGLSTAIPQLVNKVIEVIPLVINALMTAIPDIINAGYELFISLVEALPEVIQNILTMLPQLIDSIVDGLLDNIDVILDAAIELFMAIIYAIPQIIQLLVRELPKIITTIIQALVKALPQLLQAAIKLLMAIVQAIPTFLPQLIAALPEIINAITTTLLDNFPLLLQCAFDLFMALVEAIPEIIVELAKSIPKIIAAIMDALNPLDGRLGEFFTEAWENIKEIFKVVGEFFGNMFTEAVDKIEEAFEGVADFFSGIWDGIKNAFSNVTDWFKDVFTEAWQGVKDVFSTGGKIFDGIKDGIASVFTTVVNGIIKGINKVIAVPFDTINGVLNTIRNVKIPVINVKPFSGLWSKNPLPVPQIPELYEGTVVKKGRQYLLEGRGDEAVVPLHNNKKWIAKVAQDMRNELNGSGAMVGNTSTVNNYNFNQTNNSPKALSRLEIYRQTKNQLQFAKGV